MTLRNCTNGLFTRWAVLLLKNCKHKPDIVLCATLSPDEAESGGTWVRRNNFTNKSYHQKSRNPNRRV